MITHDTPAAWQRGETMGLVHIECVTSPAAVPVDLSAASGTHHLSDKSL